MDDLISREAAIKTAAKGIWEWMGFHSAEMDIYLEKKIDALPAVDAVPVVRCRECRYWRHEVSPTEHWVCAHHSFNERKMYTTPVFYCADGERRDES